MLPSVLVRRPPGFDEKIENLMGMGFSRGDCELALRGCHGNVDRAAHALLSGQLPAVTHFAAEVGDVQPDSDEMMVSDSEFEEEEDEEEQESQLRRFTRFRNSLVRDPAYLRVFLNRMATENPAIAGLIRDDPAAFLGSIGLNPDDFDLRGLGRTTQYEQLMAEFSDSEKKSIRALEQLGIDTMTVIQVFVACEKNEALTRKCLLSMQ
jgi:UV excision repair protein RAD23